MPTPPRPDSCEVAWEVAPDVYCLGPRGRTQTDVYFIRSGSSWALIDTGWAHDGPSIKRAAEAVFGAGARPASILLTHCHPDHAGSALQLARAWECAVYVHPQELPIATGDFTAMTDGAGPLDVWVILPLMRAVGQRRREAMLSKSSLRDVVRPLEFGPGHSRLARLELDSHTGAHPGPRFVPSSRGPHRDHRRCPRDDAGEHNVRSPLPAPRSLRPAVVHDLEPGCSQGIDRQDLRAGAGRGGGRPRDPDDRRGHRRHRTSLHPSGDGVAWTQPLVEP